MKQLRLSIAALCITTAGLLAGREFLSMLKPFYNQLIMSNKN